MGIDLDDEKVLVFLEAALEKGGHPMEIICDVNQFLSVYERFLVIGHCFKSHRHNTDHHIQQDYRLHNGPEEEDCPIKPLITTHSVCKDVVHALEIANGQGIRVSDCSQVSFVSHQRICLFSIDMVQDVKESGQGENDEEEHSCNGSSALENLDELSNEGLEECKDL